VASNGVDLSRSNVFDFLYYPSCVLFARASADLLIVATLFLYFLPPITYETQPNAGGNATFGVKTMSAVPHLLHAAAWQSVVWGFLISVRAVAVKHLLRSTMLAPAAIYQTLFPNSLRDTLV